MMRDEDSSIRVSVIGQAILNSILLIAIAYKGSSANPHIPSYLAFVIAGAAAWILSGIMIRTNGGFSYPARPVKWFLIGAGWGILWGIAPGLILGWNGGAEDLGMLSWLGLSVLIFSLFEAASSFLGALTRR